MMTKNPRITYDELANILRTSRKTIARDIDLLRSKNIIDREGEDKNGRWVVKIE